MLSTGHRRDQYTVVCQILWHQPVKTLVDGHRQLEPDALADEQPVEFAKQRGDVIELPGSYHHSGGLVLDDL